MEFHDIKQTLLLCVSKEKLDDIFQCKMAKPILPLFYLLLTDFSNLKTKKVYVCENIFSEKLNFCTLWVLQHTS